MLEIHIQMHLHPSLAKKGKEKEEKRESENNGGGEMVEW